MFNGQKYRPFQVDTFRFVEFVTRKIVLDNLYQLHAYPHRNDHGRYRDHDSQAFEDCIQITRLYRVLYDSLDIYTQFYRMTPTWYDHFKTQQIVSLMTEFILSQAQKTRLDHGHVGPVQCRSHWTREQLVDHIRLLCFYPTKYIVIKKARQHQYMSAIDPQHIPRTPLRLQTRLQAFSNERCPIPGMANSLSFDYCSDQEEDEDNDDDEDGNEDEEGEEKKKKNMMTMTMMIIIIMTMMMMMINNAGDNGEEKRANGGDNVKNNNESNVNGDRKKTNDVAKKEDGDEEKKYNTVDAVDNVPSNNDKKVTDKKDHYDISITKIPKKRASSNPPMPLNQSTSADSKEKPRKKGIGILIEPFHQKALQCKKYSFSISTSAPLFNPTPIMTATSLASTNNCTQSLKQTPRKKKKKYTPQQVILQKKKKKKCTTNKCID
ncbi:hypothetical protein RFI_08258, partial [Reticulomyxa filosa]